MKIDPPVKYSFFFDFHTPSEVPGVGKDFDAEKLTGQLRDGGIDFLTCPARCNRGNAYYDTKIGRRHPALEFDLIRALGGACRRRGIRFSVYFNGHLSEEETIAHPEWTEQPLHPGEKSRSSPFYRPACYNSPYADHLTAMALELAEKYPVDGFFFDCMMPSDCVCPVCVTEMRKRGYDPCRGEDVKKFSAFSVLRLCRKLHDALKEVNPDFLLFFNGCPFEDVKDLVSHFEAECLPTSDWGYETLPVLAHYLPALDRDKTILNMTGRFYAWGDFGGLRTAESLEFDMFYGLAHGMRPDLADHMHPGYDWPQPVADRVREVYAAVRKYDEWTLGEERKPEIALLSNRRSPLDWYPCDPCVKAAVRMLTELKVQFDLITENSEPADYRLLIIPDNLRLGEKTAALVRKHLLKGGKVLAFGSAGLAEDREEFALPEFWPGKYISAADHTPLYFAPEGRFAAKLPRMPLSVYAGAALISPADDSVLHMELVRPFFNRGWDGLRNNYYAAPDGKTGEPFILEKGNVLCVTGELFAGYAVRAPRQHRDLLKNLLSYLDPRPQLQAGALPSFARAFLCRKDNAVLLHLLAYAPEKRGDTLTVEDRLVIPETTVAVRTDESSVGNVFLAPEKEPLKYVLKDGYCRISVPQFSGYALVVLEM